MISVDRFPILRNGEVIFNYHGIYKPDSGEAIVCGHFHRTNGHALDCAQRLANQWHKEND